MDDLDDGLPTLDDAGVGIHEMYVSYTRAGFSKRQAMALILRQLSVNVTCERCGHIRGCRSGES